MRPFCSHPFKSFTFVFGGQTRRFISRWGLIEVHNSFENESEVNLSRIWPTCFSLSAAFRVSTVYLTAVNDRPSRLTPVHSTAPFCPVYSLSLYPVIWCPPMGVTLHLPVWDGRPLVTDHRCSLSSSACNTSMSSSYRQILTSSAHSEILRSACSSRLFTRIVKSLGPIMNSRATSLGTSKLKQSDPFTRTRNFNFADSATSRRW